MHGLVISDLNFVNDIFEFNNQTKGGDSIIGNFYSANGQSRPLTPEEQAQVAQLLQNVNSLLGGISLPVALTLPATPSSNGTLTSLIPSGLLS